MSLVADYLKVFKNMKSEKGYKYTQNGQTVVLKNLSEEEAFAKLEEILTGSLKKEEIQEAKKNFPSMNVMVGSGNAPKYFKADHKMTQEEMEARFDYSAKCRKAVINAIKRRVKQEQLWTETVKRTFSKGPVRLKGNVSPGRWMDRLLKLDGSPESRLFNEKLVTLAALVWGDITKDQFEKKRYAAHRKAGKSRAESKRLSHEEREYGTAAMLDILKEKINASVAKKQEIIEAEQQIISGKATDIEKAYELAEDDGIAITFTGKRAAQDLDNDMMPDEFRKDLLEYGSKLEEISCDIKPLQELTGAVSLSCYSYLDPVDMYKSNTTFFILKDNKFKDGNLLAQYASDVGTAFNFASEFIVTPKLRERRISPEGTTTTECGVLVFNDAETKQKIIIDTDISSLDNGFHPTYTEDVPGRLISKTLSRYIPIWLSCLDNLNQDLAGDKLADLKTSIKELGDIEFDDIPSAEQIGLMAAGIEKFKSAADEYGKALDGIQSDDLNKASLKASRAVAGEMLKFASNKAVQLKDVKECVAYINVKQADAERTAEALSDAEKAANAENNNNLDNNEAQIKGVNPYAAGAHFTSDGAIQDYGVRYANACAELAKPHDEESLEARTARAISDAEYEMKADTYGKKLMAANVVKELLNMENALPNGRAHPMNDLADKRKIDALMDMVSNSEIFLDKVRTLDFSQDGVMNKQMAAGAPKALAKNIMKNYLQFNQPQNQNRPAVNADHPKINQAKNGGPVK